MIRNFITGRTMAVRVGDEISTWEPILSDVPQGSDLGLPLFLLFSQRKQERYLLTTQN